MNNYTQEITMPTEQETVSEKDSNTISWTKEEKENSKTLYGCEIIQEKCNPEDANNFNLPNDSYLISYSCNEAECFDIARSSRKTNIFDMYWDKFGKNLKNIEHTQGRVNPKLWGFKVAEKKKRK